LFAMIYLVDCIPSLRHFVEGGQEVLYENSILKPEALARNMLSENDLQRVARDYGRKSYQDFERITLEKDGRLTGILKKEFRESQTHHMPLTQQKRF
jgi:uncharacterized membrane protein YcaP (DUF421 family)